MALEKVPPLKEVLAGRVRQDLAEDIYILQYRHTNYPDEIAEVRDLFTFRKYQKGMHFNPN